MRKRKVIHKCDYCGDRIAKYYFPRVKKWCCGDHVMRCPVFAKQHSVAMKGKKFTEEHKQKLSKVHKGKTFSKEARKKMSKAAKKRCSTEEYKKNFINPMERPGAKEKFKESMQEHWESRRGVKRPEHSLQMSGSGHFNWQGGKSIEPYCDAWADKEFKEDIKKRDNYTCQLCSSKEDLCIHHINYEKKDCYLTSHKLLFHDCRYRK